MKCVGCKSEDRVFTRCDQTLRLLPRAMRQTAVLLCLLLCAASLDAQTVLLGNQGIQSNLDSDAVGLAEAFPVTATASGQVGSINFFLDESSAAAKVYVGIYNDAGGKPGSLLTQGSTTQLFGGTWNSANVTAATITSGTAYWIAILGTSGGKPYFYDQSTTTCNSQTSSQSNLASLPSTWSKGKSWNTCNISAYAVTGTSPATVMIGDQAVESNLDKNPAGQAEAFPAIANTSGSVATLNLYLDATSGSGPVYIGLYADNGKDHPGTLLGQGSTTSPVAGSWNQISIASSSITAGSRYWIALLGTQATSPYFHDRQTTACHSETSSQTTLTSLPATWTTGKTWNTCYISAYGLSASGSPILSISPSSLSFSAIQGGANPASANLSITNTGTGTLSFTDSTDQSWLSATPASGTAPQTLQVSATTGSLTPGTYTGHVTVTAAGAQNSPASATVTFTVAAFVPPAISASVSPTPDAYGWNNSAVTVTFTCSAGSYAIQSCPAAVQVSNQGANQPVTGTVIDVAGNSASTTVNVSIDLTPPVITASASPPPNSNGWNNTPVTVTFTCSDSLSGIATCPTAQTVSTQGTNQVVSGTATDKAGNSATVTTTLNIDLTGPKITASITPQPNSNGWNNSPVTVTFTCTAGAAPIATCPGSQTVSTAGANQTITGTVTDVAGLTNSAVSVINIGLTPPTILASVAPTPNRAGWNNQPVTVTFACSDAVSDIAQCPSPVVVSTAGANQVVSGTAINNAGYTATTSVTVSLELAGPMITATASPAPNASGWNNSNVTVTFNCTAGLSPILQCPAPQTISAQGSNQSASGIVTDTAGFSATAVYTVKLDESPPLINILAPANNSNVNANQVTLQGMVSDGLSGVANVTCNGVGATVTNSTFSCTAGLVPGSNNVTVSATDVAGNTGTSMLTVVYSSPIAVQVASPAPLQLFSSSPVTVTGTVSDPNATVTVGGVIAAINGASFTATGVVLQEGTNLLTASATDTASGGIGSDSVSVILDTTPPVVHIDSPVSGAVVTSPQVDVTGGVNDMVTGTVNGDQVSVVVNGVSATVANRSFAAHGVLLVPGQNTITAVATDRAGNTNQNQVQVTLQQVAGQTLSIVSGNDQSAPIRTLLPQPLVVLATNALGQPMANVALNFSVLKSDGFMISGQQQGRQLTIQTGANGQASVQFQLGSRNGAGINQVSVSAPGFVGQAVFSEDSTVGTAAVIHTVSGEWQMGAVGVALAEPLVAIVFDAGGNPVANVPVTFTVQSGGGLIGGGSMYGTSTDSDGKAYAVLVLGQQEGINNNVVTASFPEMTGQSSSFISSGVVPGPAANTIVSGLVLDDTDTPIPNATASIQGTNLSALTNAQGQFTIANAPVGDIVLYINGATSTSPYTFPTLSFQMATIPGVNNTLGHPVYLPALDTSNSQVVGGDQPVQLTMTGVPGLVYTVAPNSVTFPDGSHVGTLTLSQVHGDRVPMAPPNGTAPRLVGTLQPAGVLFNPPIQMQLPNTDGLAPGQVEEIFSFHHDLEQFVVEGTARVSQDGSVIVTDPGFGLTVSGWHGGAGNQQPGTCGDSCNGPTSCGQCVNGACQTQQQINDVEMTANGSSDPIFVAFTPSTGTTVQFSATVDADNCTNYTYQWNFNDGTTVTDSGTSTTDTVSHTYMAADSYLPTVTVSCDTCPASLQAEVDTNVVQIQIDSPCTDNPAMCSLSNTLNPPPAMPMIQGLSAQVVGIDPDPTPNTTFNWTAQVTLQAGDCNGNSVTVAAPPVQETVAGGQWTPNFAGTYGSTLYGGQLDIKANATVQGLNLTGDTKMQPDNDDEHILGTNPSSSDLMASLPNNTLRAIACQESGGLQFVADNSPQHIAGACPNWAHDNPAPPVPGVGVMQITPNTGIDIWNWVQNANEGTSKLTGLPTNNPGFYANQISRTNTFNNIVTTMIAQLQQQNIVLSDVIIPDLTSGDFNSNLLETQLDVIRGYNGYSGRDQFGLPLHEWQVEMDTSKSYTAFLLTPIDPTTHLASTQWVRVPASQRPGNNNYVNLVLGQPPLNGGSSCQ